MGASFKNILIIKPSSLGDIVQALPAVCSLRKSFPDATVSWLVRPEFAPLIEGHRCIDRLIYFDRKLFGRAWFDLKALGALFNFIKKLRSENFDVVFDFQGLFRTALFARLTGAKRRFGFSNAREFASSFYTDKVQQDESNTHLVDFYIDMVRRAGGKAEIRFDLPINEKAKQHVELLLNSLHIKQGNYACLVPGSAQPDKCWPVENFALLADKIKERFNLPILAVGTKSESVLAQKIKIFSKANIINLAGQTDIQQLKALLKSARLVVSNDTGPGHIGRSNPARVRPYNKRNGFAAIEPFSRGFKPDNFDHKYDIKNVTVEMVFQKVCAQLDKSMLLRS
jgi:heptosyltransferase-1